MNKITFKKITPKQYKDFFKFFERSIRGQFLEYSIKTREYLIQNIYSFKSLTKQLRSKESVAYGAFNGNEYVGYLFVSAWPGGVCYFNWLAVAKEFQGKGIASKLIEIAGIDAKIKGFHKIRLETDKRNLKFYKKNGFKFIGKIPKYLYGADDYLLYKTLQKPNESKFLKSTKI